MGVLNEHHVCNLMDVGLPRLKDSCHVEDRRTHLCLSQLTVSLHVLEAASLSAQLSLHVIQFLLSGGQLTPARLDTDPQGIQLTSLISHLPLQAVMLAAGSVKQALQLPDLTLFCKTWVSL